MSAGTDPDTSRLRLRALTVGYRAVIEAAGVVDEATLERFAEVMEGHVASRVRELWVDLSRLEPSARGVVHVLAWADRALTADGRRLAVIGADAAVRAALELAGVRVHPDRSSAHHAA
jgi:anti-anti-sigma regulatory factor